uniref:Uncharacterized protein n=1 Tax=Anopheles coluzzii TaxID=1518534 RepID=A0A8W7PDB1_ANOCL
MAVRELYSVYKGPSCDRVGCVTLLALCTGKKEKHILDDSNRLVIFGSSFRTCRAFFFSISVLSSSSRSRASSAASSSASVSSCCSSCCSSASTSAATSSSSPAFASFGCSTNASSTAAWSESCSASDSSPESLLAPLPTLIAIDVSRSSGVSALFIEIPDRSSFMSKSRFCIVRPSSSRCCISIERRFMSRDGPFFVFIRSRFSERSFSSIMYSFSCSSSASRLVRRSISRSRLCSSICCRSRSQRWPCLIKRSAFFSRIVFS